MRPLAFVGKLPASKSILNRLLLAQSYFPELVIHGDSQCDDVKTMRQSVQDLLAGRDLNVGSAGTVLRFMALRASRLPGRHRLIGEPRLFSRPQDELIKILRQVGVYAELKSDCLEMEGSGWKLQGDTLQVPSDRSSQFASAVLLNAWELPAELFVSLGGRRVSEGYWRMSVQIAEHLGMKLEFWDGDFRIQRMQKLKALDIAAEVDLSSAFALAGVAAVNGQATFLDFPEASIQPDARFVSVLKSMGVPIERKGTHLHVGRAPKLSGIEIDLRNSPDMFPVLAVLCALAEGPSHLKGAPHLIYKESDRLNAIVDWVKYLGRQVEVFDDGIKIAGPTPERSQLKNLADKTWDSDQDHRLAFAAAVAISAGAPGKISHHEVVTKSFPDFWKILGWDL
jgi:3-phosphoshikimate 1-carboxyvinyltransferase